MIAVRREDYRRCTDEPAGQVFNLGRAESRPCAERPQPEDRVTASLMKGLVLMAVDNVAQVHLLFADTIMFGGAGIY